MNTPKTITISTTDWELIETVYDEGGFTFRPNGDIEFATSDNPAIDEIIPILADEKNVFKKAKSFYVKGAVGTIIYFAPYKVQGGNSGGASGNCSFSGVYQTPSGFVSGTTCQEWIDLHFPSQPPTISIRGTVSFGLYEIGQTLTTPLIEVRGGLGSNPAGTLTDLSIVDPTFSQVNPTPGTRYGTNDGDITIINGPTKTYNGSVTDSEGRIANASGNYSGAYPYYGTSVDITTLTKQVLQFNTDTYFQVDMVAETGGNKYKADFEDINVLISGVQFFNTVSQNWERMGGSKTNSLALRDTTSVTHTVQGNVVNYTRYTYNGSDGGNLQVRFYQ